METRILLLIGGLAIATIAIRALGLITGNFILNSRHAWVLRDLPGVLIVSLVASSLANMPLEGWIAAVLALAVAMLSNHVITTMLCGVLAYALLENFL